MCVCCDTADEFTGELLIMRRADTRILGHAATDRRCSRDDGLKDFRTELLPDLFDDVVMLEVLLDHCQNEPTKDRICHAANLSFRSHLFRTTHLRDDRRNGIISGRDRVDCWQTQRARRRVEENVFTLSWKIEIELVP